MDSHATLAECHLPSLVLAHPSSNFDIPLQATTTLGSLFKLTESFLIDESHVDGLEDLSFYCDENGNAVLMKASQRNACYANGRDTNPPKTILLPGMKERFKFNVIKYWCLRYQLFSKFDCGIKLDEEGWYSVTPEVLAKHHAARSGKGVIIDCFAGMGGNAIQFAMKGSRVIAVDISPKKVEYAHYNAKIYGVADRIDFIVGDFFKLAPSLKGDVVFLSPPWGGPDYIKVQKYDINKMLKPEDGFSLFKTAQMIAPEIIMFLPKNTDINQLAELALRSHPPLTLEVEKNFINGQLKTITAYYRSSRRF